MDLISKYLNLSEAWPGTPEWKKKHDPSYNPYDPEGKVRKALKLKPYGYRDSKPASDEDETPSEQPAMKKRGRPKKMKEEAEQIEELKSSTMMSYKDKANKEIKALDTEVKTGEYKDIAAKIMDRRMKGVDKATNKLDDRRRSNAKLAQRGTFPYSEEVEEIEELSKSTLASYAKKATRDARIKMATGKDFERIATSSRKPAYKTAAATWERRYKGDARKREAGVEKAIDRLAKEEVALDEISSMAHAKYRTAARADIKTQSKMLDADNKAGDRIQKRVDGLARSTGLERVKKMTKEEVIQKYLNVEQSDVPFKADKPKQSATPGKYGVGYSTARHLARMGLKAAIKDLKKGPEAGKKQVS